MKANSPPFSLVHPLLCWIIFASLAFTTPVCGQIQQAWVAHYNNGMTNGQHQALKVAIGSDGDIDVCGFSQNANSNLDYAVLKYAGNGNLLWAARFDSTNVAQAKPTSFVVDSSNNAILTGNAGTIKYDATGKEVWFASLAGASVAADSTDNVYLTGYSYFNSTKLSANGTNIWN